MPGLGRGSGVPWLHRFETFHQAHDFRQFQDDAMTVLADRRGSPNTSGGATAPVRPGAIHAAPVASKPGARFRPLAAFKYLLTLIGARLSGHSLLQLQMVVNHLKIGRWMRDHHFTFSERLRDRHAVWDVVARQVRDRQVLYLEFGVFSGHSMRYWSRELKHPGAVLHGFDSFEGLPEEAGRWTKGQFSTGGRIPEIDDPRVQFFKGWFNEVLPTHSIPPHEVLVINMDADLYSSTIYVLQHLRPHIKPGTFIYFDEMNHMEHEPRAFDEFVAESGLKFRAVCADKTLTSVFFECTA